MQLSIRKGGRFLTQWSGKTVAPAGFDPIGIGVDSANRVYIADTDNDRVEVFSTV